MNFIKSIQQNNLTTVYNIRHAGLVPASSQLMMFHFNLLDTGIRQYDDKEAMYYNFIASVTPSAIVSMLICTRVSL